MGKLKFMQPVTNERKDWFGAHRQNGSTHYGIDYGSPEGTEVHASERGKVERASFVPKDGNYGYTVIIDHTPENSNGLCETQPTVLLVSFVVK
ncbi:MAG: M23 family metallopeptidase [Deltaproteobacteria bacterium]|nr:M23 family metallopeptidase [Deltaproteobacteria bacterium]